jgi:hypothetical protein
MGDTSRSGRNTGSSEKSKKLEIKQHSRTISEQETSHVPESKSGLKMGEL